MSAMTRKHGEELFASHLDYAGYSYEREFRPCEERRWRCDFFIEHRRIIVEIEGVTYSGAAGRHQRAIGYTLDCEKYNWLTRHHYRVFRFTPAMVAGTATAGKKKRLIEKAIDTLDRYVIGPELWDVVKRTHKGYIARYAQVY